MVPHGFVTFSACYWLVLRRWLLLPTDMHSLRSRAAHILYYAHTCPTFYLPRAASVALQQRVPYIHNTPCRNACSYACRIPWRVSAVLLPAVPSRYTVLCDAMLLTPSLHVGSSPLAGRFALFSDLLLLLGVMARVPLFRWSCSAPADKTQRTDRHFRHFVLVLLFREDILWLGILGTLALGQGQLDSEQDG